MYACLPVVCLRSFGWSKPLSHPKRGGIFVCVMESVSSDNKENTSMPCMPILSFSSRCCCRVKVVGSGLRRWLDGDVLAMFM